MQNIQIKKIESTFSVPMNFVDKYMASADATFVKIYIYILRHVSGGNYDKIGMSTIAADLGILESDVIRSLNYWNDKKVINFKNDKSGYYLEFLSLYGETAKDNVPETNKTPIQVAPLKSFSENTEETLESNKPKYILKDINSEISSNKNISDMFAIAQQLLGKTLTHNDVKSLYSLYDWLHLPTDVILMLVEYCTTMKKVDLRYIEKVAITWSENGINTMKAADTYIKGQDKVSKTKKKIKKILQISGRDLTELETKFVNTWLEEYKADDAQIKDAYEKTIMNIGKLNFKYLDAILKNGDFKSDESKPKGTRTPAKRTSFNNFTGEDNISDFEKDMMARRINSNRE